MATPPKITIETLHTVDTEYSADSVEWCPQPGFTDYFLCGTYQLIEHESATDEPPAESAPLPSTKRKGRLYVFHYDATSNVLTQRDSLETAAILDAKWLVDGTADTPTVAVANGLGEILLYQLNDGGTLKELCRVHLDSTNDILLTTAIDWSPPGRGNRRMTAIDSAGHVSLLELRETGLELVSRWPCHEFEGWTCAFDRWDPNVLYSGGDEMALAVHDLRVDGQKVFTNRTHTAGITTLLSAGDTEHRLVTGSYDDQLRVFDTRQLRRELASVHLGGGVWRVRQNPERKDWLLCANMYHNFSVVEGIEKPQVVAEYFEHGSICYGADWSRNGALAGRENSYIMGTCSFYDHKLCVSRVTELA